MAKDYGVPQLRERNIFLLVRKDINIIWEFPEKQPEITLLSWFNDPVYLFRLEQNDEYQSLSSDIKSQLKRAVKLYMEFAKSQESLSNYKSGAKYKALSLFANIGVSLYFISINCID